MAYATGTVLSLNEVYDALQAFMVANGWTLLDSMPATSRDKVFTSNGVGGGVPMIYRLTSSAEAYPTSNPFWFQGHYGNKYPHISARGYTAWATGPHTGTNEFGRWGPSLMLGSQYQQQSFNQALFDGTPAPNNSTRNSMQYFRSTSDELYTYLKNGMYFDGHRLMYGSRAAVSSQPTYHDVLTGKSGFITGIASYFPGADWNENQPFIITHDPATDKDYVWVMNSTGTDNDRWLRGDFETGVWVRKAAPGFGVTPAIGWMCWDGGDYIYCNPGSASTQFRRYSISLDTWTALTATPAAKSGFSTANTGNLSHAVYLPAAVTGLGEDVILVWFESGSTTIRRYNVTANTWTTAGTMPTTANGNGMMIWDGGPFIYAMNPIAAPYNQFYRSPVSSVPPVWTSLGTLWDVGGTTPMAGAVVNHLVSKVRCSDVIPGAYFISGNADAISLVVRVGAVAATAHYYWMYFGRYDPAYRNTVLTLTDPASPGIRVTVNVTSSVGYVAGESLLFWDPSTGTSEKATIYDVPTGTSFRIAKLVGSFAAGTRIGMDPVQHTITGDSGAACAPLGAKGFYKGDYQAAGYQIVAHHRTELGNPSNRGSYMPVPIRIEDPYGSYNKEVLGTLKGAFFINKASYPAPQAEDILLVGGAQYKFFPLHTVKNLGQSANGINSHKEVQNFGLIIGPIA